MPKAGFGASIDIISFSGFECPSSYHGLSLTVTECHGVCHRLSIFLDETAAAQLLENRRFHLEHKVIGLTAGLFPATDRIHPASARSSMYDMCLAMAG